MCSSVCCFACRAVWVWRDVCQAVRRHPELGCCHRHGLLHSGIWPQAVHQHLTRGASGTGNSREQDLGSGRASASGTVDVRRDTNSNPRKDDASPCARRPRRWRRAPRRSPAARPSRRPAAPPGPAPALQCCTKHSYIVLTCTIQLCRCKPRPNRSDYCLVSLQPTRVGVAHEVRVAAPLGRARGRERRGILLVECRQLRLQPLQRRARCPRRLRCHSSGGQGWLLSWSRIAGGACPFVFNRAHGHRRRRMQTQTAHPCHTAQTGGIIRCKTDSR